MSYDDNGQIATGSASNLDTGTYSYNGSSGSDAGQPSNIGTGYYFTYDSQGNRTCESTGSGCSGTKQAYTWDEENRLAGFTSTGGATVKYWYDGNGELMQSQQTIMGTCPTRPGSVDVQQYGKVNGSNNFLVNGARAFNAYQASYPWCPSGSAR